MSEKRVDAQHPLGPACLRHHTLTSKSMNSAGPKRMATDRGDCRSITSDYWRTARWADKPRSSNRVVHVVDRLSSRLPDHSRITKSCWSPADRTKQTHHGAIFTIVAGVV